MEEKLTAGQLLGTTGRLLREHAVMAVVAFVAMVAAGTAYDLARPNSFSNLPASIAAMVAQFALVRAMLNREGRLSRTSRAGLAFVGLAILSSLGVMAGFVLLIVPGVILTIRWSTAVPTLLAEEVTVSDSLSISWQRTKGQMLPIFLAFLPALVPLLGLVGIGFMVGVAEETGGEAWATMSPLTDAILTNICIHLWEIYGVFLSVAIYLGITRPQVQIEEVFA